MRNACINCDYGDKKRTNNKGQIRCNKFNTYKEKSSVCAHHTDNELEQLFLLLEEEK